MFLVDKDMPIKEIKKEIDEILKPIKSFCDFWGVQFQYDNDVIKTNHIAEKISDDINLVKQREIKSMQESLDILGELDYKLNLFTTSAEHLKPIEQFLVYHILIADKTQVELTEDEEMWNRFQVYNISPAKINHIFQAACLKLLELIKYYQIKNMPVKF